MENQYETAHAGAAAIRRVVASNHFDGVVTENRGGVEAVFHENLQHILASLLNRCSSYYHQLQDVNPPVEVHRNPSRQLFRLVLIWESYVYNRIRGLNVIDKCQALVDFCHIKL
ncbi:MAG: hypothetical protein LRY73_16730 [Bacillus sp. (in: Bacteria)]|nr:hypothetical protein [Bacillus sp. (in: firmicutes)]